MSSAAWNRNTGHLSSPIWLRGELSRRAREAGLRDPDALGSQLALLVDGVAARVVVDGPQAAQGAVADAVAAARALVAAA